MKERYNADICKPSNDDWMTQKEVLIDSMKRAFAEIF